MGFGRKMGAFLGLVPDDARNAEDYADGNYADEYADYDTREATARGAGRYARDAETDHHDGYRETEPVESRYAPRGETRVGESRSPESRTSESRGRYTPTTPSRNQGHSFADEPVTQGALAVQPQVETRPADTSTSVRPVTVKLTSFGEARIVGEKYRDGQPVIMEMTDMADSDARRLVDFAAGLAFARRGSIDKVATKVFMLLPPDVDVSAEERREYAGAYGPR